MYNIDILKKKKKGGSRDGKLEEYKEMKLSWLLGGQYTMSATLQVLFLKLLLEQTTYLHLFSTKPFLFF